jgi:hypothetical protein
MVCTEGWTRTINHVGRYAESENAIRNWKLGIENRVLKPQSEINF